MPREFGELPGYGLETRSGQSIANEKRVDRAPTLTIRRHKQATGIIAGAVGRAVVFGEVETQLGRERQPRQMVPRLGLVVEREMRLAPQQARIFEAGAGGSVDVYAAMDM